MTRHDEGERVTLQADVKSTTPVLHQAEMMPLLTFVANVEEEGETLIIPVTAYEAAYVLKHRNRINRPLRLPDCQAMARDMANDRWDLNGENIKFALDGSLIDGQHRFTALASLTDMPDTFTVRFHVCAGLMPKVQKTMNTGIKRTPADMFRFEGIEHPAAAAAVSRKVIAWESGNTRFTNREARLTIAELLDFVATHPRIHRSVEISKYVRNHYSDIPPSIIGLAHYLFSAIDEETAAWFFQRLADGAELKSGHPVHTLRESLRAPWRGARIRLPQDEHMALLVRTWNAVRQGKTLARVIGLRADGQMPMPE
jgi:hypothetical protein